MFWAPAHVEAQAFAKLNKDLVHLEGGKLKKLKNVDLTSKKYVAFYYSAHWCSPCRAFTPKLSKWYDEIKKEHGDDFELIFVSNDRSEDAMEEYMKWGKMNFPALDYKHRDHDIVEKHSPRGIPHLVVLNQQGKSVFDKNINRNKILDEFKNLLN